MNRKVQSFRVETESAGTIQVNILRMGHGGLVTVGKPVNTPFLIIRKVIWVSDIRRDLIHLIPN